MRKRLVLILLFSFAVTLPTQVASAAQARLVCPLGRTMPDSDAPAGSSAAWLPNDEWVMERWMPFDSTELTKVYGMTRPEIFGYLRGGDTTLETLAEDRGISTSGLAERLLASRRTTVGVTTWTVLLARTHRMLTQGHLAEHVIGHAFHNDVIWERVPQVFGITRQTYEQMSRTHATPIALGARGGISTARLRQRVLAVVARTGNRGVAVGAISASENAEMQRLNNRAIDIFLSTPRP